MGYSIHQGVFLVEQVCLEVNANSDFLIAKYTKAYTAILAVKMTQLYDIQNSDQNPTTNFTNRRTSNKKPKEFVKGYHS